MKTMKSLLSGTFAAVLFGLANVASANIVGDLVNVTHRYPDTNTVAYDLGSQIVPYDSFNEEDHFVIQVYGSFLIYNANWENAFTATDFNGVVLTDLQSVFTSATLDVAATTHQGFDATRLWFDDHHIYLNMQGLQVPGFIRVEFDSRPADVPVDVPEPASIALVCMGMLGLAGARRKPGK